MGRKLRDLSRELHEDMLVGADRTQSAQQPEQRSATTSTAVPPNPFDKHWHLHVDGKTYGSYTGHQIRQMVEQHKIVGSDLVYGEAESVRGEAQFQGGYDPIISQLNRLKVQHLTMEFTAPGAGDMAVFKKLREDFEIGLGCVSVTPGQIDSAETIVARVKQAAQFLAPERIVLNPDCGFAPGSGAAVSIDEAYRKLCNEAAAATILRAEFS